MHLPPHLLTWKRVVGGLLVLSLLICAGSSYRIAARDRQRAEACVVAVEELRSVVPRRTAEAGVVGVTYSLEGLTSDGAIGFVGIDVGGVVDFTSDAWVLRFPREGGELLGVAYVGTDSYVFEDGAWRSGVVSAEESKTDESVRAAVALLAPGSLSDPRTVVDELAASTRLDQPCSRLSDDSAHIYSRPWASSRLEHLETVEVDEAGRVWRTFVFPSSSIYSSASAWYTYGEAELPPGLAEAAGLATPTS